jgi:hypothetical protein
MALMFGFNLNVASVNRGAYYYANFTTGSIAEGGAVTFYPTQTSATYVSIQASFGAQAPAGGMVAGLVVSPDGGTIAGNFGVSPAINVPVTATLYGARGPIDSVTIPAGETSANFSWDITGQSGITDVEAFTKQAPQP